MALPLKLEERFRRSGARREIRARLVRETMWPRDVALEMRARAREIFNLVQCAIFHPIVPNAGITTPRDDS